MKFAVAILTHTPVWVFLLFGFLVWQGWKARQTRTVSVWRLLITPTIFLLMSLSALALHHADGILPPVAWVFTALVLALVGYTTGPRPLAVCADRREVTLPASWLPLLRNVLVFTLQYGFAVTTALHPEKQPAQAVTGRIVSGATAGYFLGWAAAFWRHRREASGQKRLLPANR